MTKLDNAKKSKRKIILYSVFSLMGAGIVATVIACPIVFINKNTSNDNSKNKAIFLTPIQKLTSAVNDISPSNDYNLTSTTINNSLSDIFEPNKALTNGGITVSDFVQNPKRIFTIKNPKLFDSTFSKMYNTSTFNSKIKNNTFMGSKFALAPILNFWSLYNANQFVESIKNTYNAKTKTYNITSKDLYTKLENLLSQSKTCLVNFIIIENNADPSSSKEFLLGNFKSISNVNSTSVLNSAIVLPDKIDSTALNNLNEKSIIYNAIFDSKSNAQTISQFLKEINKYYVSIEFIPSYENALQWLEQNSYNIGIIYEKLSTNKFQLIIQIQNNESKIIDSKSINIEYSKNPNDGNTYIPYNINI